MTKLSGNWLSTKQAAEKLGISPMRVRQLIADGRLPTKKIGRDHLILESDLSLVTDRPPGRPKMTAAEKTKRIADRENRGDAAYAASLKKTDKRK